MAGADLLIMPSYFESLSMVALEAWALGKPVLANAKCDVLKGQCVRSNAGLYYERYAEFAETLHAIEHNRWLSGALGRNGRQYFQSHYDWRVIERKYLDMLAQLQSTPARQVMEPLPDRAARRREALDAANDVLVRLPRAEDEGRRRA
jgi:glycosyltransferase involved in cell wall biosynthesis